MFDLVINKMSGFTVKLQSTNLTQSIVTNLISIIISTYFTLSNQPKHGLRIWKLYDLPYSHYIKPDHISLMFL